MGLQTPELVVIMFIILLLFGGKKLPELARSMGSAVQEYTKATKEPVKYAEAKTTGKSDGDKGAILEAARKMGIETKGRDISEIAQDIVKTASQKDE